MKTISQADFLRTKGLNPSDKSEDVQKAKKEYERLYQMNYRKRRKQRSDRFELWFDLELTKLLQELAEKMGISVTALIKKIVIAYFQEVYVLPNEEIIRALRIEIRRVGNNLNQVVLKINASNLVFQSDIRAMQKMVKEMEGQIAKIFHKPIKLLKLNREALKTHPEFLHDLKKLFKEFEST